MLRWTTLSTSTGNSESPTLVKNVDQLGGMTVASISSDVISLRIHGLFRTNPREVALFVNGMAVFVSLAGVQTHRFVANRADWLPA